MAVKIVPYETAHIPAVHAFNARLRAAGVAEAFGMRSLLRETNVGIVRAPGSGLYEELFLALDGDAVRGGYSIKHQEYLVNGVVRSIGFFQQPLSEGTIDKRFALIGPRLLRDALGRQPLLYALGIGGYDQAAARLLKGARFTIVTVPFSFRVEHAARFLRQVGPIRTSRSRRLASDVAAATGIGALGIGLLQRYRAGFARDRRPVVSTDVSSFGPWADAVWLASQGGLALAAVRDRPALAQLYDGPRNPFLKVTIENAGVPCGWAVCLATQRRSDKYFGDLKLGSIVDLLAVPGYEGALIGAAVDRLRQEDVDLIVTNLTFGPLVNALRDRGFLGGPSNFLFAASPVLAQEFPAFAASVRQFHMTRGDGDGPVNL